MRRSHVSLFIRRCSRKGGELASNAIPRNHVDTQSTQSRRRAHTQANSPRTLANRTWPPRSWRRVPGPLLPVQSASPAPAASDWLSRPPFSRRATVVRIPESRIPQRAGDSTTPPAKLPAPGLHVWLQLAGPPVLDCERFGTQARHWEAGALVEQDVLAGPSSRSSPVYSPLAICSFCQV